MCQGVALLESEMPWFLVEQHARRIHRRGEGVEGELRFLYRDAEPMLPIWHEGVWRVVRWGNRRRRGKLPPTGWTWKDTVEAGGWSSFGAEPVNILCNLAMDKGVWFRVRQGIRGLLVRDEMDDELCVYMICEPATRYYSIMTRSDRMPTLIQEVI